MTPPPILDKAPISSAAPCVCQPVNKFWFWVINPAQYGFPNMTGWSINGNDFILGANSVMIGLGGSGTAVYLGGSDFTSIQCGWIAYYGLKINLPTPEIKDPSGNIIDPAWSYFLSDDCSITYADFPSCAIFEYPKTDPNIGLIELYWFSPYMWNTLTGYPTDNGNTGNEIDFQTTYGGIISLANPAAATIINNIISPMFLNGTSVTITSAGTKYDLKISSFYGIEAGFRLETALQWRTALRTLPCP